MNPKNVKIGQTDTFFALFVPSLGCASFVAIAAENISLKRIVVGSTLLMPSK